MGQRTLSNPYWQFQKCLLYVPLSEANELEISDFDLWGEKQRPLLNCCIISLKSHHTADGLVCTYASLPGYSTSSYISSELELGLKAPWPGVSLVTAKASTYSPVRKTEKPPENNCCHKCHYTYHWQWRQEEEKAGHMCQNWIIISACVTLW